MDFLKAKTYISKRLRKELPKHLSYHSTAHIKDVYESARRIGKSEGVSALDLKLILTAAMYHDCGFTIQSKNHEKISCDIVKENLPNYGFSPEQIKTICGMIMATQVPQKPKNHLEEILCDADLDYLGRSDFFEIGNCLFHELKVYGIINTEEDWNQLQIRFLEQHHYFTKTSIANRKPLKDIHLSQLKNQTD